MLILILVAAFTALVAFTLSYFLFFEEVTSELLDGVAFNRLYHQTLAIVASVIVAITMFAQWRAIVSSFQQLLHVQVFGGAVCFAALVIAGTLAYAYGIYRLAHFGGELHYPASVRKARRNNPRVKSVLTIKKVDRALKAARARDFGLQVIDLNKQPLSALDRVPQPAKNTPVSQAVPELLGLAIQFSDGSQKSLVMPVQNPQQAQTLQEIMNQYEASMAQAQAYIDSCKPAQPQIEVSAKVEDEHWELSPQLREVERQLRSFSEADRQLAIQQLKSNPLMRQIPAGTLLHCKAVMIGTANERHISLREASIVSANRVAI